MKLKSG